MRRDFLEPLYNCFDSFLSTYIIAKNSFLTNESAVLLTSYIEEIHARFIDDYKDSKTSFEDKFLLQFNEATYESKLNFAHAEWLWCFSVGDISQWRKEDYIFKRIGAPVEKLRFDLFPETFGHAGQWHTNNKYWEITFCVQLIDILSVYQNDNKITEVHKLKVAIEELCNHIKYEGTLNKLSKYEDKIKKLSGRTYAMSNILLYLVNPEKYERIASDNHKNRVVNSFTALEKDGENDLTIDERILNIRLAIATLIKDENFDFYDDPSIKAVWNFNDNEIDFDELQALLFKKAIVFYGPPGTSKTYKAKELAATYILNQYINDKSRLIDYLSESTKIVKSRIHHLQLHANYTYENFIGGYLLNDGNTVLNGGSFLKICEDARIDLNDNQNLDIPHVLILDEMNRVDLSKLFGEAFSALEQRDHAISIGIENLTLNIPRNLHIIGTMNEIDFSVEQIDFALRRRFLWFFYGYREERLKTIIQDKSQVSSSKIELDDLDRFYRNVSELNTRISSIEELGKMYQIGHAFFSDIVSIYNQYKAMKGYVRKSNFLFENNGPTHILWNISIQPILEAFMGNQDERNKEQNLKELKEIFLKQ